VTQAFLPVRGLYAKKFNPTVFQLVSWTLVEKDLSQTGMSE
jgi:hypothetical protein